MKIIVNDIDGNAHECVACGTEAEVRRGIPPHHPVQSLITEAIQDGGRAEDTYEIDGEEFTTQVIATQVIATDADDETEASGEVEDSRMTELRKVADSTLVKDGGLWPINPATGQPICDRCECDAVRVSYSSPDTAVFFCATCNENDPCDVESQIVRRDGDPNTPWL